MSKKIAISQSNYIPWKGYFDFINTVDEFVLYDEVQYTKRDWRNRNRIKTPHGIKWITIPVKGSQQYRIDEVCIAEKCWNKNHWNMLSNCYGEAPFFEFYADEISQLYKSATNQELSAINHHFLKGVNALLDIDTPLSWSTDYEGQGGRCERLISICKQADANIYVSGPTAKSYLDVELFNRNGITVEWMDYSGYKEYPQLFGTFEHAVTILDVLFNTGPDVRQYLKTEEAVAV